MEKNFGLGEQVNARDKKGNFKDLKAFGNFLGETNPEFKAWATDASHEEVATQVQRETGYFAQTIIEALNLKDAIKGGDGNYASMVTVNEGS